MKALRQFWARLSARYAPLSTREKALVAAVAVGGPLLVGQALLVDPKEAALARLERTQAQQRTVLAETQAQLVILQQQLQADPDAVPKAELAELEKTRQALEAEVRAAQSSLVLPGEMNALLERFVARHKGLRLLSLKTLAPESVLTAAGEKAAGADKGASGQRAARSFDLYRHGVEIRLEGSYADLQSYLAQLEQSGSRLIWGRLNYRVVDYPRAELTLTVYTLSPERTWLAL